MLDEKLKAYAEMFDDGFPMIPLGWGRTDEEIAEMIDRCIEAGKDAYDIGFIVDDDEVQY